MTYQLRPYQQKALDLTKLSLRDGHRKILLFMATGCVDSETYIRINRAKEGIKKTIKKEYESQLSQRRNNNIKTTVRGLRPDGSVGLISTDGVVHSGFRECIKLTSESGKFLILTPEHRIYTKEGWVMAVDMLGREWAVDNPRAMGSSGKKRVSDNCIANLPFHKYACEINTKRRGKYKKIEIHNINGDHYDNSPDNLECLSVADHLRHHSGKSYINFSQGKLTWETVSKIESVGVREVFDVTNTPSKSFTANDIVIHNSGKGLLMSQIVHDALRKGNKVLTIMRRVQVVIQTASNYKKYHGIDSGVIMASHKVSPEKSSQICSIDTVIRRIEKGEIDFLKQFQLVVVDECHDCTSPSYQDFFKFLGDKIYLGFSASPFMVGKKVHSFWDCVVKPIETHDLRDQGFLTNAKVYVPTDINLENIKTISGDYAQSQLSDRMQEMKIVGDVVENYKRYGENKAAICFCVDKNHSMLMSEMFNRAGIPAAHCDESTKQTERDLTISKLKSGEIKIISNVNIFSTGVDIPCLEVGLMARPTKSEILFIQQVGRILRPYRKCGKCKSQYDNSPRCPVCGYDRPEHIKEEAIIIDFGNNTSRFGLPFDVRHAAIKEDEKEDKETVKKTLLVKTCKNCFMVYDAKLARCPNCEGAETKERIYKTESGELILYNEFDAMKASFTYFCRMEIERRWKPNSKHFKMFEKYGDQYMKFQKEFKIPAWIPKIHAKNMEKDSGKIYK